MNDESLHPLSLYERIALKAQRVRAMGREPVALAYGRKSFVKQGQKFISTEYHEEICRQFCDSLRIKMEWYADDKKGWRSGRAETNRPEWQLLKQQIGRPEVIMVICENTRAVFRNAKLILTYIDEWMERGNDIEFVDISMPTLDVRTPDGRAMLTVKAAFDESESRRASSRLSLHIKAISKGGGRWGKANQGLEPDGKGPERKFVASVRGYWLVRSGEQTHYVIGAEDAPPFGMTAYEVEWRSEIELIVQWLTLYVTGKYIGVYAGARRLNAAGWRWRTQQGTLRRIQTRDLWRTLEKIENYRGILSNELIDRALVHKANRAKRKENGAPRKYPPQPLTRLVYCPVCGARFKTDWALDQRRNEDRFSYAHFRGDCENEGGVACHKIDAKIWEILRVVFALTDEQKHEIALRASAPQAPSRRLRSEHEELRERLRRLGILFYDGLKSEKEYKEERAALLAQIEQLPEEKKHVPPRAVSYEQVRQLLDDVPAVLFGSASAEPQIVNNTMHAIFRGVYIRKVLRPYSPSYLRTVKYGRYRDKPRKLFAPPREWQIVRLAIHTWALPLFESFRDDAILAGVALE